MSKIIDNVTAGSTLDLVFSFTHFSQEVIPSKVRWTLIKRSNADRSKWDLIDTQEIEPTESSLKLSIPSTDLNVDPEYTLDRMLIVEWGYDNMMYKESLTFTLNELPTYGA